MKLTITVKTNAKRTAVEKLPDGSYRVAVNAPPVEGKANAAVVRVLSNYFSVPQSAIRIVKGMRGKRKIIEIVA